MVDQAARNALAQRQLVGGISQSIEKVATALKGGLGDGADPHILANEFRALRDVLSKEALDKLQGLISELDDKLAKLTEVSKNVPRAIEMNFPKEYPVRGSVDVNKIGSLPDIKVTNLNEVSKTLAPLLNNVQAALLRLATPKADKPNGPVSVIGIAELIDGIEELKTGFNLLLNKDFGANENGVRQVELVNFKQMIPQPVTSININPLRGLVATTAVTVTTIATKLPGNSQAYRRSVVLYNNGSVTFFLGGSDVTASNGMPVPAGTYSPALDIGPNMLIYGITSTSSADVRVMELSSAGEGGSH